MVIPIALDAQSYDIILENGALARVGEEIDLARKVLIVTDSGVPTQYAETVAAQCKEPTIACLPQGEGSKNFDNFRLLLSKMLEQSFTRKDCVVAVGGGMVGDLAAFVASCYMRGVEFYNVPTTLLSQLDSSIGGKTAIDFEGVKNIVGSFYQPSKVIIDPDVLATLGARELRAGLAEGIKMAAIRDAALFELIEKSTDLTADLPEIIRGGLLIKKAVVEEDPKEQGVRRILNFGHTIGHAVESYLNCELLHGECVALGMLPMCSDAARERLCAVLQKYGLATKIEQSAEQLMPYLLHDKKRQQNDIVAVFVDTIGKCELRRVSPAEILGRLENK